MNRAFGHDKVAILVRADAEPIRVAVRIAGGPVVEEFVEIVAAADQVAVDGELGDDGGAIVLTEDIRCGGSGRAFCCCCWLGCTAGIGRRGGGNCDGAAVIFWKRAAGIDHYRLELTNVWVLEVGDGGHDGSIG